MVDRTFHLRRDEEPDERLVSSLRRYDEQLREGFAVGSTIQVDAAASTDECGDEIVECLQLLERVWPRHRSAEGLPPRPTQIGRFKIEGLLGQGGFGIVYLARDPTLDRSVALKIPRVHALLRPEFLERFRREGRAAGGLDHPHIVAVYEAGEADGVCYIAAAYCPGPTLSAWLKEHPSGVPPRTAAELVAQLADAVAYSHSRGVLHRDIKPGNVLLSPRSTGGNGEQARSNGRKGDLPFVPRLGDFGLAKVVEDAAAEEGTAQAETVTHAVLGTPAYMAPEQIVGGAGRGAAAVDIYSLGAVLYELLTGRPPFQGSPAEVLEQSRTADPVSPRRLNRSIPRDLETISLKCLEKEPGRRYAGAEELRDDLRRFLEGEPIRARPPGAFVTGMKWMRRRPAAAALVVTVAIAVLAAIGLQWRHTGKLSKVNSDLSQSNSRLRTALGESERLRQEAIVRARELKEHAYGEAIVAADTDLRNGDVGKARGLLAEFVPRSATDPDVRGIEWDYLNFQANGPPPVHVFSHGGAELLCAAISPDARMGATGAEGGILKVWDLKSGSELASIQAHDTRVVCVEFSGDGRFLASGGSFHQLNVWRTDTWERVQSIEAHDGTVQTLDFSQNGRRLVTGGRDGWVRVWDWQAGSLVCEGEISSPGESEEPVVYKVRFTPDGEQVVSAVRGGRVLNWDVPAMTAIEVSADLQSYNLTGSDVSADGRIVVATSGYNANDIVFTRRADGRFARVPKPIGADGAALTADGGRACLGFDNGQISVFDVSDELYSIQERRWRGHGDEVMSCAVSAEGRRLLTASRDGTAKLWDIANLPRIGHTLLYPLEWGHEWGYVAISPDGQKLAVTSLQAGAPWWVTNVYSLPDGKVQRLLRDADAVPQHPSFRSDGKLLFMSFGARLGYWDVIDGSGPHLLDLSDVVRFEVHPDGRRLIVAHLHDGVLRIVIWDRERQQIERVIASGMEGINNMSLSSDGKGLAVAEMFSAQHLDLSSGTNRHFGSQPERSYVAELHPDGEVIAVSSSSRDVKLYDVESGRLRHSLPVQLDVHQSRGIVFAPGGRLLAISNGVPRSPVRAVSLWDWPSNRRLFELPSFGRRPVNLAWSPDGRSLAAAASSLTQPEDGQPCVIIWHLSEPAGPVR